MVLEVIAAERRHVLDRYVEICKYCGKGWQEVQEQSIEFCSGTEGVLSIEYMRQRASFVARMQNAAYFLMPPENPYRVRPSRKPPKE